MSGTYLNSRVGTFQDFTEFGQAATITGQRFPYTPAFSGAGTLAYDGPVGNDVHFIADANVSYQTDTQADLAGTSQFNIKSYELVDGSVGLRAADNSGCRCTRRPARQILLGRRGERHRHRLPLSRHAAADRRAHGVPVLDGRDRAGIVRAEYQGEEPRERGGVMRHADRLASLCR
ncbi:hypothetical protein AB5I41_08350 [Sphingomonas sp. MMS24-JH45]